MRGAVLGSVRFRTTMAATVLTAIVLAVGSIAIVQVVELNLTNAAHSSESEGTGEHAEGQGRGELSEAAVAEIQEGVDAVVQALAMIVPALTIVLGAGTWFMVGRALRPVHNISGQVTSITATTLDERVPVPASGDEIAELAGLMNEMLDRLQNASDRQRQFVADASHELRSPLSTIKAAAEISRLSEDPERMRRLAEEVDAEADRMEMLISDLLDLARLDEDAEGPSQQVDVTAVCRDVAGRFNDIECSIVFHPSSPVLVEGPASQIERAVFNILLNGTHHAESKVRVVSRLRDNRAVVAVDDDGPGISPELRSVVFDRFARGDESRARSTGGAGLGLAIVKAIASQQGGSITVDESPDLGGASFTLDLGPVVGASPTP